MIPGRSIAASDAKLGTRTRTHTPCNMRVFFGTLIAQCVDNRVIKPSFLKPVCRPTSVCRHYPGKSIALCRSPVIPNGTVPFKKPSYMDLSRVLARAVKVPKELILPRENQDLGIDYLCKMHEFNNGLHIEHTLDVGIHRLSENASSQELCCILIIVTGQYFVMHLMTCFMLIVAPYCT